MATAKGKPAAKPAAAAPAKPVVVEAKAPAAKPVATATKASKALDASERQRMIAEAAYYIAEKRGFIHGHHDADWAEAERQIDALLAKKK